MWPADPRILWRHRIHKSAQQLCTSQLHRSARVAIQPVCSLLSLQAAKSIALLWVLAREDFQNCSGKPVGSLPAFQAESQFGTNASHGFYFQVTAVPDDSPAPLVQQAQARALPSLFVLFCQILNKEEAGRRSLAHSNRR